MFARILKSMKDKIRSRNYLVTLHAEEEMNDDDLSIFDVERVVLTGKIIQRQKDQKTKEWKYLVKGETIGYGRVVVVGKLSITGKLVIITVYKI